VLKPSELTPHTAIHLMRLLEEAGLPPGVGDLVLGAGPQAGAPLGDHPDVDLVSFTGGLHTGRRLVAAAAGTSHNSCIAFWAPAESLDDWAGAGCSGWSAADLFPLHRRLENNDAPGDRHGRTGPVKLRTLKSRTPCGTALLEACAQAGIPTVGFNTGRTVIGGANWFQINSDENNIRQSSAVAQLHPIMDRRPNPEVRTGVRAKKLILDGRRCVGAEYLDPDLIHRRTERAGAR
jgi:choline dehydrogenase-like flavoprotein